MPTCAMAPFSLAAYGSEMLCLPRALAALVSFPHLEEVLALLVHLPGAVAGVDEVDVPVLAGIGSA